MTDKEFLDLLMRYRDGRVPALDVGLALAKNQFSHEYIALANDLIIAKKRQGKVDGPHSVSRDEQEIVFGFGVEGVRG